MSVCGQLRASINICSWMFYPLFSPSEDVIPHQDISKPAALFFNSIDSCRAEFQRAQKEVFDGVLYVA